MPTLVSKFSKEEIDAIRSATPGLQQVTHFNNAGASLMPQVVADRLMAYLNHELLYGGYETYDKFSEDISRVYPALAAYLRCSSSEIAIVENATVAWGQAFQSIPFQPGDHILTSTAEYASNYIAFLQLKKRMDITIEAIPNDHYGQLDINAMESMIHEKVKLIAITHVPTNGGLVNPAAAAGTIAQRHNILYLLDACQSAGQMPLNVKELGCDFLSATSRKYLRGPRGVGFLYINQKKLSQLEPPLLDLHGATWTSATSYEMRRDARRFENWESNMAGIVGLTAAVDYAVALGIDRIWQRIQYLAQYLRDQLKLIPGVKVQDLGEVQCGIVSFSTPLDTFSLKSQLQQAKFNVSIIRADGTLLDMQSRGLEYLIRASVHYYNSEEDIDRFTHFLSKLH